LRKVAAVLREELGAGFALTGIDVVKVRDFGSAWDAVRNAVEEAEYGLIIVDECYMAEIEEQAREYLYDLNIPLIVPVPCELRWSDAEEPPSDDFVAALIRKAVGYQLNITL
jgi:vacuolar-type H+-ATPase subunit F/Vma7